MPIKRLDHVNIRTTQLDEMITWYSDVLGLESGWRPEFPFAGAWMYAGEYPVVHLIEVDRNDAVGSEAYLKLEHFAFSASDEGAFESVLNSRGIDYRCGEPPNSGIRQYNVFDPDGNHIHVDFEI